MQYYLAPMEGITGFVYRNAFAKYYGKINKYFTPFLSPHTKKHFAAGELRDILPENNKALPLVPQILTNNAGLFLQTAEALKEYGYEEINLNLGCPSRTVVTKKKGAGLLGDVSQLDHFLEEIFEKLEGEMSLSVKTRLGMSEPEEFETILVIYNKYPLSELIIHTRVQKDYYGNIPRVECFEAAAEQSRCPVIYNGNLFSGEDLKSMEKRLEGKTDAFMLGRGIISRPWLLEKEKRDRFQDFHDEILEGYSTYLSGDRTVLFRMKELWTFMATGFLNCDRYIKKIKKSTTIAEYKIAVSELLRSCSVKQ